MRKHIFTVVACIWAGVLTAQNQSTQIPRGMVDVNKVTDLTLDSLNKANTVRPKASSSRKGNNPVLFLVGNSTMRTRHTWQRQQRTMGMGIFRRTIF